MYNPSRGGVRGGADQFTWESVKNDKHRENYLGHSIMAPVGRWQKGKDLSWYAKERKDGEGPSKLDRMELASIKKAEEEAMLIALGHNVVRKETQKLSKEDIRETLKRSTSERDGHNIERVDGVGASSKRLALLSNAGNDSRNKTGVAFEGYQERVSEVKDKNERKDDFLIEERKKSQKKSKKHKKEKKHKKKHHKESYDSDSSENDSKYRSKHKKGDSDSDDRKLSSKTQSYKKSKYKHKDYSSDDSGKRHHSNSKRESYKRHEHQSESTNSKKYRYDISDSD